MITPANESAPGICVTRCLGASDPSLSWKAGPMAIMPYRPAYLRHRHAARPGGPLAALGAGLAEIRAGLDVLNLGVIDADLNGSRANARVDEVFTAMRELADEVRDYRPGDVPDPVYDERHVIEAEMPAGHPDSMIRELGPADEEAFIALCCSEFTAEDRGERGGAS